MSIKHIETKIKREGNNFENRPFFKLDNDIFVIIIIILTSFTSFGIGRLSINAEEKSSIQFSQKLPVSEKTSLIYETQNLQGATYGSLSKPPQNTGSIVASKNGTKYHFPWCSGAKNIKEENKIWFNNEEEAKAAGYSPASNCKGLN